MQEVIVVIHLLVVLAMIGLVLIQRSQGGGLGIGGATNFMTSRGSANLLTRSTAILGAIFFSTSLLLALLSSRTSDANLPGLPSGAVPTLPGLPGPPPSPTEDSEPPVLPSLPTPPTESNRQPGLPTAPAGTEE